MRRRTTRLVGLGAALALLGGGPVLAASPAAALSYINFAYGQHAPGLPAHGTPAQTLVSAQARVEMESASPGLEATVVLGGVPEQETDADLHLVFGTPNSYGQCVGEEELVVSTFASSGVATRSGDTITIAAPGWPESTPDGNSCTYVSLTPRELAEPVHDRLDGKYDGHIIVDLMAQFAVDRIPSQTLQPKRWRTVPVRITAETDAGHFSVTGRGKGLETRRVVVPTALAPGESLVVRLPVKLLVPHKRRLKISVRSLSGMGGYAFRQVWIKSRRR